MRNSRWRRHGDRAGGSRSDRAPALPEQRPYSTGSPARRLRTGTEKGTGAGPRQAARMTVRRTPGPCRTRRPGPAGPAPAPAPAPARRSQNRDRNIPARGRKGAGAPVAVTAQPGLPHGPGHTSAPASFCPGHRALAAPRRGNTPTAPQRPASTPAPPAPTGKGRHRSAWDRCVPDLAPGRPRSLGNVPRNPACWRCTRHQAPGTKGLVPPPAARRSGWGHGAGWKRAAWEGRPGAAEQRRAYRQESAYGRRGVRAWAAAGNRRGPGCGARA